MNSEPLKGQAWGWVLAPSVRRGCVWPVFGPGLGLVCLVLSRPLRQFTLSAILRGWREVVCG